MVRRGLTLFLTIVLFGCRVGVRTPELLPGLPSADTDPRGWLPAPEEAEQALAQKRAEREQAKLPESVDARGRTSLEKGNAVDAVAEYRRALRKDPKDERLNLGMANALYRTGDLDDAQKHAQFVLQGGGPGTPEAAQLLVTLEQSLGRNREARDAAQKWAQWSEQNGQAIAAMDAWLLVSRISHMYLNDASGTYYALEKARALVVPTNAEAATRFRNYEGELQRMRMGKR